MVHLPKAHRQCEEEAFQRFRTKGWDDSQEGVLSRDLYDGTRFEITENSGRYYVKFYFRQYPDDCENRWFATADEAKDFALMCYRARLLFEAVSRELHPSASQSLSF